MPQILDRSNRWSKINPTCKILVSLESRYGIWPSFFFGSARALTTAFKALILKTERWKNLLHVHVTLTSLD